MAKKQSLEAWIRDARNDSEKDGACTAIALVHFRGMKEEPVWDVKFKKGGKVWDDKVLADIFTNKAEAVVQDLEGKHTFNLHVFYEGSDSPQAKRIITVTNFDEEGGLSTENPTNQGMRMQEMRQREQFFQSMMSHQQSMIRQSTEMVQAMGSMFVQMGRAAAEERNASAALMRENRESQEIIMDMMMKKITDGRAHEIQLAEYQRKTEERRQLIKFIPALANTVTGHDLFPQGTADTVLIEQIAAAFDQMDEGQVMGMANVIPPALFGPLMARFQKWKTDQENEKKRIAALAPPVRDPAADAAGDPQPSPLAAKCVTCGEFNCEKDHSEG